MSAHLCECGCGRATKPAPYTYIKRGWIQGHPLRFLNGHNGRIDITERFWAKVEKTDSCWLWQGAVDRKGYGAIGSGGKRGRTFAAHRLSWQIHFGLPPLTLEVCHHCDNPPCVNPTHLFLGTHKDNMSDAQRKGRMTGPRMATRGEANGAAKLTTAQVQYIRHLYTLGVASYVKLARQFQFSPSGIRHIIKRHTWKDI